MTRTKLYHLIDWIEVSLKKRLSPLGKAVADLVPSKSVNRAKAKLAIDNLLKIKKIEVPDKILSELREAGRK